MTPNAPGGPSSRRKFFLPVNFSVMGVDKVREYMPERNFPHSTEFSGGACHRSSKSSGGEDLQIEEPILGGDCVSFRFHSSLSGMLSTTLVGHEVVQMG
jgi:hypothetical protein